MSERGKFMIYCAELYKGAKHLSGAELDRLFSGYGVWDYVRDCYGALHTTGPEYIIEDIDAYIAEHRAV